jgi:hypothetical protein
MPDLEILGVPQSNFVRTVRNRPIEQGDVAQHVGQCSRFTLYYCGEIIAGAG